MKRILVYGDSNTWGHVPARGTRYPDDVRWPGVAAKELGEDYRIIEDSISGRTTVWDDPVCPMRCGKDNLGYSLLAHAPLDLVALSLGVNDLKFTDADGVVRGVERLVDMIRMGDELFLSFSPIFRDEKRILLIAPAPISDDIPVIRPGHALQYAAAPSHLLPEKYRALAEKKGLFFLDASLYAEPSPEDAIHFSPESHRRLGAAAARKIAEIFQN